MKDASLQRLYDRLQADERFRLVIEALARDDNREVERLVRTCPRRSYQSADPEFMDRWRASVLIADAAGSALFAALEKLELLRRMLALLESALDQAAVEAGFSYLKGYDRAIADGQVPVEQRENLVDEDLQAAGDSIAALRGRLTSGLGETVEALEGEAASILEGLRACCREEMGTDAEAVIAAFFGPNADTSLLEGVSPNRDSVDGWTETLKRPWRELVER